MLFTYALGLLAIKVNKPLVLAVFLALMCFGWDLIMGAYGAKGAGFVGALYFVFGFGWFWVLEKISNTIFLWFLVFVPTPFVLSIAIGIAQFAMFGKPVLQS